MQRHEMIEAFAQLGLKGMAGAFDETVTTGLQRNRTAMENVTYWASKPSWIMAGLLRLLRRR